MSGHSKWANIKIKKGKTDAIRGKIFTKIGREIAIAVREGERFLYNPDPTYELASGCVLIVLGESESIQALRAILQ